MSAEIRQISDTPELDGVVNIHWATVIAVALFVSTAFALAVINPR